MVVVAIIGVLTTIAIIGIGKTSRGGSADGFAATVTSTLDMARMRAVSTRRWHRVQVRPGELNLWQGRTVGLTKPTDWDLVSQQPARDGVFINAMDSAVHIAPNTAVPGAGVGLDGLIDFSPDGSGQAATIFIGDSSSDKKQARVVVYGATGTAYIYAGW